MSSVFKGSVSPAPDIKRNTFDLSFQNNLTCQIGKLYPVFCKEVVPGDSFRIQTTFGFQFMPLVFPLQTKLRATVHFFYVRNRNLWKDWPDFISKTDGSLGGKSHISAFPTLSVPTNSDDYKKKFGTRSLADYLGLPTNSYDASLGPNNEKSFSLTKGYTKGVFDRLVMPFIFERSFKFSDGSSLKALDGVSFTKQNDNITIPDGIKYPIPQNTTLSYNYIEGDSNHSASSLLGVFPINIDNIKSLINRTVEIYIPVSDKDVDEFDSFTALYAILDTNDDVRMDFKDIMTSVDTIVAEIDGITYLTYLIHTIGYSANSIRSVLRISSFTI